MQTARVLSAIAALALSPAALAGTITVPNDYPTIQQAIDAAVDGDLIVVKKGTYKENIDLLGKAITLQGVECQITVIDGSLGGPVITIANGEGPTTVITGFSIKFGTGTSSKFPVCGGGVYIDNASSPTFIDCCIGFNTAQEGAGIWIGPNCDPLFQDCLIVNNVTSAGGTGGGLHIEGNPTLDGNRIAENTATSGAGGGVYAENSTLLIVNNDFDKNHSFYGGGLHVKGGSPTVIDNVFRSNTVDKAPINGEGAGMAIVGKATPFVARNDIHDNLAHSGAGIYSYDASPTIVTNTIHANIASIGPTGAFGYGGGASIGKSGGTFDLNEVYENVGQLGAGLALRSSATMTIYGSLIDHNDAGPTGLGGGIYSKTATSLLVANTIANNDALTGGGMYVTGKSAPTVNNGIVFHNTATSNPSYFDGTGSLVFSFSDVEASAIGGTNLSIDPLFVDPPSRNYRLATGSPVVDAGDFNLLPGGLDVYGNTRVNNGRIDMGAAEQ